MRTRFRWDFLQRERIDLDLRSQNSARISQQMDNLQIRIALEHGLYNIHRQTYKLEQAEVGALAELLGDRKALLEAAHVTTLGLPAGGELAHCGAVVLVEAVSERVHIKLLEATLQPLV